MAEPAVNESWTHPANYHWSYTNKSGGGTFLNPAASTYSLFISETSKNSALMAARRRGESVFLPPLPYDRLYTRFETGFCTYTFVHPTEGYTMSGQLPVFDDMPDLVSIADKQSVYDDAVRRSLEKLKNQNVNFAQFFAEAGQTASLLGKTAKDIANAGRKIKNGNIVGALKALNFGNSNTRRRAAAAVGRNVDNAVRAAKQAGKPMNATAIAANRWLEISFGWKPLLQDIEGSAKLLAERATRDPQCVRFHVSSNRRRSLTKNKYVNYGGGVSSTWVHTGYYGYFIRMDYMFDVSAFASACADGLTNPVSLAWEELPFSFCVDYLYDIGGYLDLLDSAFGKVLIGGSVTFFEKWSSDLHGVYGLGPYEYGEWNGKKRRVAMSRRAMSGFPDPRMLAVVVNNPLKSNKRVGNLLALARQVFDSF